ncbi:MAG: hypothetical protein RL580_1349 [Pseudomonadota bacterium]
MRRRALLTGGAASIGLAALAPAPVLGSVAAQGEFATGQATALAASFRGPALLDAFVRIRGGTDGRIVHGWLRSQRSTVIDGEITPLCGVVAGAVQRFERIREDVFEATILEVAHYVHPSTGDLLDTVEMPGTGRRVKVPAYRFGPVKARFAVMLDEWEEFDPPQGGSGATQFVPRSSVHLLRSIEPATAVGDRVAIRTNEYGRVYPDRSGPMTIYYREWMAWQARAEDLARSSAVVAANYGYTALTSWRPWMQMGTLKGHTIDSGYGAKAMNWTECPPEFLELTRRRHPDVLDDPERALRSPPV